MHKTSWASKASVLCWLICMCVGKCLQNSGLFLSTQRFQLLLPAGPFRDFLGNSLPVSQWCVGSLAILCSSLCIYTASVLDRDECRAWVFRFFLFRSKEHCLTVSQRYVVGFSVPSLAFLFPGSPCYISGWPKDVLLAQSRSATFG